MDKPNTLSDEDLDTVVGGLARISGQQAMLDIQKQLHDSITDAALAAQLGASQRFNDLLAPTTEATEDRGSQTMRKGFSE